MKLTKFPQSCVLIETNAKKFLFDPGSIGLNDSIANNWKEANYIFVTHKHFDHFDETAINKIKNKNTKIYSTQEVANKYPNTKFEIVKEKDIISFEGIKIEVVKAIHGYIPILTQNNAEINENIGYILDDGKKRVYLTSDTICFKNDYKCNIILVPICNHGIVMGPFEAALFAKETGAELIIPIHYDNPKYPTDLKKAKEEFEKQKLNYKFLEIGETIEI